MEQLTVTEIKSSTHSVTLILNDKSEIKFNV
jgi:hypothetical protein